MNLILDRPVSFLWQVLRQKVDLFHHTQDHNLDRHAVEVAKVGSVDALLLAEELNQLGHFPKDS